MRPIFTPVIVWALATALTVGTAYADNGKGRGKSKHETRSGSGLEVEVDIRSGGKSDGSRISDRERKIIRSYFRDNASDLPPGLAKKQSLPPGLQKQLQKNGRLPPGLAKRQLPSDLARRLPRYDGPYERRIVGNDLILLDPKTEVILDVMQEIFNVPVDETLGKVGARRSR